VSTVTLSPLPKYLCAPRRTGSPTRLDLGNSPKTINEGKLEVLKTMFRWASKLVAGSGSIPNLAGTSVRYDATDDGQETRHGHKLTKLGSAMEKRSCGELGGPHR
jgi:hypothetical protein